MSLMPTIAYHTLGCKVNQYETEKIREALERAGSETVPFAAKADAYIINTCTVTGVADSKSRAAVRRALKLNPDAFIVVSGCYAELEPTRIALIEGVDLVVTNSDKDSIAERVISRFGGSGFQIREEGSGIANPGPSVLGGPSALSGPSGLPFTQHSTLNTQHLVRPRTRTRAIVKVQDGCDQFCSYCVVPFARSRKMSRPMDDVTAELRALAEFGYKEIVLTGIRLGSYQHNGARLPELIRAASSVSGIERIRLSSVEAWEIDDALLDAIDSPKVCRHLHVPLQSGDDEVLRRMNRPYTTGQLEQMIERARKRIPGIGITTDVIVGFPGESEEAFENTCGMVERVGFSRLHVFRYSPRKRASAAEMPGQIDSKTKKQRSETLIELGRLSMRRFAESFVGRTLTVLVEKALPLTPTLSRQGRGSIDKILTGYADNYVEVVFTGPPSLVGKIVPVTVLSVDEAGTAECGIGDVE